MNHSNTHVGPQNKPKAGPGVLIPSMAAVSLIGGLSAATQYFAYGLNFHDALGANVRDVYPPWSIVHWAFQWHPHYAELFERSAGVGACAAAVGLIATLILKQIRANTSTANASLHGSARWANKKDLERSGLMPAKRGALRKAEPEEGVFVGAWKDKSGRTTYLRHNGPEHVLCYAPTRSGKGVGLVLPTLLSWPHSTVITDLKGELWAQTAGWRQKYANNTVLRFEPALATSSARWNPLDEIRVGTDYEVGDVQNIATLIVDPDGRGLISHWQKTSQSLLVGVILHALYKAQATGTVATMQSVDLMLSDPEKEASELWMEMTTYLHLDGKNHPAIGTAGRDMLDRPEEEGGSVLSTAKSYLSLYRDPVVAANTSESDFRIKDLMNHSQPVSLYIVTQPNDMARLRPLVRIMINLVVRLLADRVEFERVEAPQSRFQKLLGREAGPKSLRTKKTYNYRLLGMFDEFPSLGKLEILQTSLAFLAGYGIKLYLICQDINQLKSREAGYGPDETITSNCHVQNAYPPNRLETAEHLSKLTGITTVVKKQVTTSGKRAGTFLGQVSTAFQESQRPLLTADECMRMAAPEKDSSGLIKTPGDMVVYVAGYPAIYGVQPLFFQDEILSARAAVEQPDRSDTIRKASALTPAESVVL